MIRLHQDPRRFEKLVDIGIGKSGLRAAMMRETSWRRRAVKRRANLPRAAGVGVLLPVVAYDPTYRLGGWRMRRALATALCLLGLTVGLVLGLAACESGTTLQGGGAGGGDSTHGRVKMGFPF